MHHEREEDVKHIDEEHYTMLVLSIKNIHTVHFEQIYNVDRQTIRMISRDAKN